MPEIGLALGNFDGSLFEDVPKYLKYLDDVLVMDNCHCYDGERYPCGHRAWCDLCDQNEKKVPCAKAYIEFRQNGGKSNV